MSQPIGFYVNCDEAECAACHQPNQWPGFEDWEIPAPIFRINEADVPTHCRICHALIPHALTQDGREYVLRRIARGDGRPEVLEQWASVYGHDIRQWGGKPITVDDALDELRALVDAADEPGTIWPHKSVAFYFRQLDAWLSTGHELPDDWASAAADGREADEGAGS